MAEELEISREYSKQIAEKEYRDMLQDLGNLSEAEITELVNFEFYIGPSSIDDQVRRYYLKLKSEKPEKAEQMEKETEGIIQSGSISEEDVKNLCLALYKYWSRFVVRFNGHSYSVHKSMLYIDGKEIE